MALDRARVGLTLAERAELLRCFDAIKAAEQRITHTLVIAGARAGRDDVGGWAADQLDTMLDAMHRLRGATERAPLTDD